jgi:GTP cyclohydrolase II
MQKFYGTTLFLEKRKSKESDNFEFEIYIFQDTITKLHILAIVYDSLEQYKIKKEINIRVHSSCITSEMLQSLDCDCVQQLQGALDHFKVHKNGILFYLIQEGRGCGYLGKSRACQITQYDNQYTTFDAYKKLGMKDDYRSYHNIREILTMFELIDNKYCLLTNNPDKINSLLDLGINVSSNMSLQFTPNPFNRKYLESKKQYGHYLNNSDGTIESEYYCPYEKIPPFEMFKIMNEYTFFISSYYLPIQIYKQNNEPIHWLQMNHFYDTSLNCEFLILKLPVQNNSTCELNQIENSLEIFYFTESIFDRLPGADHKIYREYLQKLISNSNNLLVLFHQHNFGINHSEQITKIYLQAAKNLANFISKSSISFLIRLNEINNCVYIKDYVIENKIKINDNFSDEYYVTGIGSSKYHALYMESMFGFKFIEFYKLELYKFPENLVIISQGINPAVYDYISNHKIKLLIHGNQIHSEKRQLIYKINIKTIEFKADIFDDTLSRITGVFCAFLQIHFTFNVCNEINPLIITDLSNKYKNIFSPNIQKNIYIIYSENKNSYYGIISNLLSEIYTINIDFTGHLIDFIHGPFQASLYKYDTIYLLFGKNTDANNKAKELFELNKCKYIIFDEGNIWDIIQYFTKILPITKFNIEQNNWKGKKDQHLLYNQIY